MSQPRARRSRVRMTAAQRREQLIEVARGLFARQGYEGTSVEEIAAAASVSKPIVYEHFGGKEGLYAVIVDREVNGLLHDIRAALTTPESGPRRLIELATLAMLDYIEAHQDGFRILARDSPLASQDDAFASIMSDIASQVEDLLVSALDDHDYDTAPAPVYAQALVGMVAMTGQWWLDEQQFSKEQVASYLVNLAWNGMVAIENEPRLRVRAVEPITPVTGPRARRAQVES